MSVTTFSIYNIYNTNKIEKTRWWLSLDFGKKNLSYYNNTA